MTGRCGKEMAIRLIAIPEFSCTEWRKLPENSVALAEPVIQFSVSS
jgi:hypothetical protein